MADSLVALGIFKLDAAACAAIKGSRVKGKLIGLIRAREKVTNLHVITPRINGEVLNTRFQNPLHIKARVSRDSDSELLSPSEFPVEQ